MAEFSLGLSLRASQQTLAAKMRWRNQMNRMMIFVEVASTLVMIQVGLFTDELYCIFPFLFLVVAGFFNYARMLQEGLYQDFVRRTFLSIFACEVSLLDAAKPTMTVARLLSLLARIACSFVCYRLIAFGTCPDMNAKYSCFSSAWEATTTATTATATTTTTTANATTVTMTTTAGKIRVPSQLQLQFLLLPRTALQSGRSGKAGSGSAGSQLRSSTVQRSRRASYPQPEMTSHLLRVGGNCPVGIHSRTKTR